MKPATFVRVNRPETPEDNLRFRTAQGAYAQSVGRKNHPPMMFSPEEKEAWSKGWEHEAGKEKA